MDLSKAIWRKASRSNESGDNCVELASVAEVVAVRDSKDPEGFKIVVSRGDFRCFAEAIKTL